MSFTSSALQWQQATAKTATGEIVTYTRGSTSITVTAVLGQSDFEERESTGDAVVDMRSFDFLIPPDLLVIDGAKSEPRRGDQITNAAGDVFDVMIGADGNHWRWSDHHQSYYRVHTTKR